MSIRMSLTPPVTATSERRRCGMVVYRTMHKNSTLCHKLLKLKDANVDLLTTVDEWAQWRKRVRRIEVHHAINLLRKSGKFDQALQLYEWMDDNYIKIHSSDHAIRIKLLFKLKGIEQAENHFKTLRKCLRTKKTYGALLNCYLEGNMIDKASSLVEKMREFNALRSALNYSVVMDLHMRIGQPEMIPLLFQEMEEKNIRSNMYTYNHLITSYGVMNDLKPIKGVLEKMKTYGVEPDWFTYGNMAAIYAKAGILDEASLALDEIHRMKKIKEVEPFKVLMRLHALIYDKEGVYKSWEDIKAHNLEPNNYCYLDLLRALSKVRDFEGLDKYFNEWESWCSDYDIRLPNVVLKSYLERDMLDEAIAVLGRVKDRGIEPNLKTLSFFMDYHLGKREIELAFGYLEMGLPKLSKNYEFPDKNSVSMYMNCFEEVKNVDDAEKFYKLMKSVDCVDVRIYECLIRTYIAAGKEEPEMGGRMMDDNIEMSDDVRLLLEKIGSNCSE